VFCALVASGVEVGDWEALEWLERAGVPEVWCTDEVLTARAEGYVVVNARPKAQPGSQTWPGRTNGRRRRVSVLPSDETFAVVWPDAEPDDTTVGRLARLAAMVPYVGRSTSWAEVTVAPAAVKARRVWVKYRMVPLGTAGSTHLRIPFPGYLAELRQAYEHGHRSWHVAPRTVAYAPVPPIAGAKETLVDGPYTDLLIWSFPQQRAPVGGDDVLTVTSALRRAVLSRMADPVPAEVSGHGADGRPHVAYLGLPNVGNEYADGRLLGVGVAIPRDLSVEHRRALLRGLIGSTGDSPISEVRDARGRCLPLTYEPDAALRWGLREDRWRTRHGQLAWVTATPLMLDRFPKHNDVAAAVAASVVIAGYPEPVAVETLSGPAVVGGILRPRRGTLPQRPVRRPLAHCRVRFADRVRGPVLAGSLRYLGCGLFIPEVADADA
jgi:CRISPR-associated protein Csb2